ncbi:coiled-coil domain-containing protein 107 [Carettochelys insculpta]|uniref:coiled-coil domain-containing protein 107 n=1 Tax=Carettochelys insculpta TaxID=44489 RepID=UPI003EBDAE89
MAVSAFQQGMVSVVLLLCLFVAVPRLFGGGGAGRALRGGKADPARYDPHLHLTGGAERVQQSHLNTGNSKSKTYQSFQQMRNAMEKDRKSERTRGNGKDLAFTLMPLYTIGVGVFAAYKFLKMKSQEGSSSKNERSAEDKAKETEHQLLELEQHLAQTEKILTSLLTQLDPLSNCVSALASEQKAEIMTQLQSIKQLMKESGLDKSEIKLKDVNHTCKEKLEDLIQSLDTHTQEKTDDNEDYSMEDLLEDSDGCYRKEEPKLCNDEFTLRELIEPKVMINREILESEETELRRRNRYESNMHIYNVQK